MSGKNPRLNPLQSRKQLLVIESEINRVQLCQEWQTLTAEAGRLADKARSFNTVGAAVISVVSAAGFFKGTPAAAKTSWLEKITGGVRLASTVWQMFRSRGPDSNEK